MVSRIGMHRVAAFYVALFAAGLVVAKVAGIDNPFTTHHLSTDDLGLRAAAGVGAGVLLAALSALAGMFFASARSLDRALANILGPISWDEALIMAGLSGIAEEVLFRGALQPIVGLPVASALFMLAHFPPVRSLWAWTVTAGLAGVVLGLMTLWSGDLVAAITAHVAVNAIGLSRLGRIPS